MNIIDDKEVGEMWKFWCELEVPDSVAASTEICKLIRKLVDEEYLRQLGCFDAQQQRQAIIKKDCQNEALKRYRIDPADWKAND